MLIEFLTSKNDQCKYFYENDDTDFLFSSNNNLSFRKSAYKDKRTYPIGLKGGEDLYLCLAFLKSNQRYCINTNMTIEHYPRLTILALLKQFYSYGQYFASAIITSGYKEAEIFTPKHLYTYFPKIIKFNFAIPIMYFIHSLSMVFLFYIISLFINEPFKCFAALSLVVYFIQDIRMLSLGVLSAIKLAALRFIINFSLIVGSLFESIKRKSIIIPPPLKIPVIFSKDSIIPTLSRSNLFNDYQEIMKVDKFDNLDTVTFKKLILIKYNNRFYAFQKVSFFYGWKLIFVDESYENLLLRA